MTIRIAWIQGRDEGSAEQNHAAYLAAAQELTGKQPDLIVFPELFLTHYFAIEEHPRNFDLAIPVDHPFLEDYRGLARTMRCSLVVPFFERRSHGIYQNSLVVLGPDGTTLSHYRKSHIPDDPGFYEKYYFVPGDTGFSPVKTAGLNLGTLICWDQWFPEPARILALRGAELLVYPTAIGWDSTEPDHVQEAQLDAWRTSMRAHAIHNRLFVLAVNRCGREGHLNFWGHSFLCGPDGVIRKECGTTQESVVWEIDLSEIDMQRRIWPHLRDRRVDQYADILRIWCEP